MSVALDRTYIEGLITRALPGVSLVDAQPLTGGVSATLFLLNVSGTNGVERYVARVHAQPLNPFHLPVVQEYQLLCALTSCGLPVPNAVFYETDPHSVVIMNWLPGESRRMQPRETTLEVMAQTLVAIHELAPGPFGFLRHHSEQVDMLLGEPDRPMNDRFGERQIRDVLADCWPLRRREPDVVLHGDYWPGNLLWRGGDLTGIVDWEDAALGHWGVDIGIARMEILWEYGEASMDFFTGRYFERSRRDRRDLAIWDLLAALRPLGGIDGWGLPVLALGAMREAHHWFVMQACARLARGAA